MKMTAMPLFDKLARPVQIAEADLNKDGKQDYIVCEFGNLTGALSWMENWVNDNLNVTFCSVFGAIKPMLMINYDGLPGYMWRFSRKVKKEFFFYKC